MRVCVCVNMPTHLDSSQQRFHHCFYYRKHNEKHRTCSPTQTQTLLLWNPFRWIFFFLVQRGKGFTLCFLIYGCESARCICLSVASRENVPFNRKIQGQTTGSAGIRSADVPLSRSLPAAGLLLCSLCDL